MQSSKVAPVPPKMSRALPIVRSTLPALQLLTRSRSRVPRPPPAYVTGIEHHSANLETRSWSMPRCSPSLSAAWMRNSEQYGSSILIESALLSQLKQVSATQHEDSPWVISISVMVCHLFIATNQVVSFRRQLRSMTSLFLSLPKATSTF
jgi:hypothetical protein